MEFKLLISPILAIIALVLCIAGAATGFIHYEGTNTQTDLGLFKACSHNKVSDTTTCSDAPLTCKKAQQAREAVAAFAIISCIFIGVAAVFGILRIFVAALNNGFLKLVPAICLIVGVVATLITWPIAFSLYDSEYCNAKYKDTKGVEVGPTAPLFLVAFVVAIVAVIVDFVVGGAGTGAGASSGAPAAAASADAPAQQ